jgi:hypothetical protein
MQHVPARHGTDKRKHKRHTNASRSTSTSTSTSIRVNVIDCVGLLSRRHHLQRKQQHATQPNHSLPAPPLTVTQDSLRNEQYCGYRASVCSPSRPFDKQTLVFETFFARSVVNHLANHQHQCLPPFTIKLSASDFTLFKRANLHANPSCIPYIFRFICLPTLKYQFSACCWCLHTTHNTHPSPPCQSVPRRHAVPVSRITYHGAGVC